MRWQSLSVKDPIESAKRYQRLFSAHVMELKNTLGESSFYMNLGGASLKLAVAPCVNADSQQRIELRMKEKDIFSIVDSLIQARELFQIESTTGNLFYTDVDGNIFEIVCIK
ncbi:hypothetical protein [Cellvibrio sp. pealriver]|uniref:hypothetical protein n=1 Tax=Cellvibrio sp. pealriver TaxID=1622269 RepID=UPI00066FDA49|nr:hypothetical protein [Cellvibrio sp. pealriver]